MTYNDEAPSVREAIQAYKHGLAGWDLKQVMVVLDRALYLTWDRAYDEGYDARDEADMYYSGMGCPYGCEED